MRVHQSSPSCPAVLGTAQPSAEEQLQAPPGCEAAAAPPAQQQPTKGKRWGLVALLSRRRRSSGKERGAK